MLTALRKNRWLLLTLLLLEAIGGVLVYLYSKDHIHLHITNSHNDVLDAFFPYATWLGDGNLALVFVIATLLFFDWRLSLNVFFTYLIAGGITQFLKRMVFDHMKRPFPELGTHDLFYHVPGIEHNAEHSFPSGHATGAFALFFTLALYSRTTWMKWLFFGCAVIGAYSRVYINQHFLQDILVGAIIGTVISFFMFGLVEGYKTRTEFKPLVPWKRFFR